MRGGGLWKTETKMRRDREGGRLLVRRRESRRGTRGGKEGREGDLQKGEG